MPTDLGVCGAGYVRARTLMLRGEGEARFTAPDGKESATTPIDEWRAAWEGRRPHGLTEEGVKAREAVAALFAANDRDPESAETERLRKAMEERAARANGRNGGK
jgi:hypothetical protein